MADTPNSEKQVVREHIRDWPHVPGYLLETLDHEMISSHGEALLMRALQSERVVAFLGSGVSMAYGRLGWGAWVRHMLKVVMNDARKHPTDPSVSRLLTTLEELKIFDDSRGGDLQSGRYPAAFQFMELLSNATEAAQKERVVDQPAKPEKLSFREEVMHALHDDKGHARLLIRELLDDLVQLSRRGERWPSDRPAEGDEKIKGKDANRLRSAGLEQLVLHGIPLGDLGKPGSKAGFAQKKEDKEKNFPQVYQWFFFDFHVIKYWKKSILEKRGELLKRHKEKLFNIVLSSLKTKDDSKKGLRPAHRFLIPALVRLLPIQIPESLPAEQETTWLSGVMKDASNSLPKSGVNSNMRSQYLPAAWSPLAILADELGIRRFLTTNYDVDIEKLLQERGFNPVRSNGDTESSTNVRFLYTNTSDALGARAGERVFAADHAAELIDFSIHDEDKTYDVMHLHGRAVRGERMIVTESDYQQQYLRPGEDGEIVRDALGLAFGVNVNFFVGNGMSEDDILRPMRHFLSSRSDASERVTVALLPSDQSLALDIEQTLALYTRYGAHVVHCGNISNPTVSGAKEFRWLENVLKLTAALSKIFKNQIDQVTGNDRLRLRSKEKESELFTQLTEILKGFDEKKVYSSDEMNALKVDVLVEMAKRTLKSKTISRLDQSDGRTAQRGLTPDIECRLLIAALNCARFVESGLDTKEKEKWLPLFLAYRSILQHLPDAFRGACLCIKLRTLSESMVNWKSERRKLPSVRTPQHPKYLVKVNDRWAQRLSRHPIALHEPLPSKKNKKSSDVHRIWASESDRFFSEAPSRAMRTFLDAVADKRSDESQKGKRRVYVLLGPRGVGKGHFFECLGHERHLDEFVRSSWSESMQVPYAAFSLLNLSFSHEVISPFDTVADMLVTYANDVFYSGPGETHAKASPALPKGNLFGERLEKIGKQLKGNRVGRLEALLSAYGECGRPEKAEIVFKARLLIAINGFNLLFDRDGLPKNAQLARVVNALFGSANSDAPIDLLVVCGESGFPSFLRQPDPNLEKEDDCYRWTEWHKVEPIALTHLQRGNVTERGRQDIRAMMRRLRMSDMAASSKDFNFIHVLRHARASALLAKYFPEVVISMAAAESGVESISWNLTSREIVQAEVSDGLQGPWSSGTDAELQHGQVYMIVLDHLEFSETAKEAVDKELERFFNTLQKSRFLMTTVAAVASEVSNVLSSRSAGRDGAVQINALAVRVWLGRVLSVIQGLAHHQVADKTLDEVFNQYRIRHEDGAPLPTLNKSSAFEVLLMSWLATPEGWQLQQRILRHMALVGDPIEADVLATAPMIYSDGLQLFSRFDLSQISGSRDETLPQKWDRLMLPLCNLALELLVHRCLVFRLEPAGSGLKSTGAEPATLSGAWRFALHRLVQKNILNKIRSPDVEFPEIDFYSVSMWATQPDDLPKPHVDAAREISELTSAWTGFPADKARIEAESAYHRAIAKAEATGKYASELTRYEMPACTLPARLLRASLGVIRSVYSVGVVSRFHDFSSAATQDAPAGGYFEEHRQKVAWLIQNVKTLHEGIGMTPPRSEKELETLSPLLSPFLPEEVVWLYNECGLICLVQGRVPQAVELFRQALSMVNTHLEPEGEMGALTARIHLNLGVMEIERGRAQSARRYLSAIRDREDENPVIRLIARGLLALTEHLAGKMDLAASEYKYVIAQLEQRGKSRAVAVFSRHLCELYRVMGSDSMGDARLAIDHSISSAIKGGHEDILHFCKLTRVRLAMASDLPKEKPWIQAQLDQIDAYAQTMGIRRMLAEVAYARAVFLLQLGETRHAARHACNCLRIATQMDLRLRQVTALSLLAKIYAQRNNPSSAQLLKARASTLADACGYVTAKASL